VKTAATKPILRGVVIGALPPITQWLNKPAEIPQVIGGNHPSTRLKFAG
jgi:hypothetical protein